MFAFMAMFAGCSNDPSEMLQGEVRCVELKILSDSVTVTLLNIDTNEDGKKRATSVVRVDATDSLTHRAISQIANMATFNYYQPLFVRLKKRSDGNYVVTEHAVMNYDIAGTPPVYTFPSDNHIAVN